MFSTSKLITRFIDDFTFRMKSQLIAYLLSESSHIYWILDNEGEVQLKWDLWTNGFQECCFLEVG